MIRWIRLNTIRYSVIWIRHLDIVAMEVDHFLPEGKPDEPKYWEICLNLHLSNGQTHKVIECMADVCRMIETDPLPSDEIIGSCIVEKASRAREFMFKPAFKGTAI